MRDDIEFLDLPGELHILLLSYLTLKDCSSLAEVNQYFNAVARDKIFWKSRLSIQYPACHDFLNKLFPEKDRNYFLDCCNAYLVDALPENIKEVFFLMRNADEKIFEMRFRNFTLEDNVYDLLNLTDKLGRTSLDWALACPNKNISINYITEIYHYIQGKKHQLSDKQIDLILQIIILNNKFTRFVTPETNLDNICSYSISANGRTANYIIENHIGRLIKPPRLYLMQAIKNNKPDIVENLLRRIPAECTIKTSYPSVDSQENLDLEIGVLEYAIKNCIGKHKYEIIKLLINYGADIKKNIGDKNLFEYAYYSKDAEAIKALLETKYFFVDKTNIISRYISPLTYLQASIYHGDLETARVLLANGASKTSTCKMKVHDIETVYFGLLKNKINDNRNEMFFIYNLLHLAVLSDNPQLITSLVTDYEFDINFPFCLQNSYGENEIEGTAFHLALMNNKNLAAEALINLGCKLDIKHEFEPLIVAALAASRKIDSALLKKLTLPADDLSLSMLDENAIKDNIISSWKIAESRTLNLMKMTILLKMAIHNENLKLLNYLIDSLHQLENCSDYSRLVLPLLKEITASTCKGTAKFNADIFNILIKYPHDKEELLKYPSLLLGAITLNILPFVYYLLAGGINIETSNENGKTALHLASELRNAKIFQSLILQGANINCSSLDNQTLLHTLLLSYTPDLESLIKLIRDDKFTLINQLANGVSALHLSILHRFPLNITYELIKAGANVNQPVLQRTRYYGKTPLILAIDNGDVELIKILRTVTNINNPVTIQDKKILPLQYAINKWLNADVDLELIKLLIDRDTLAQKVSRDFPGFTNKKLINTLILQVQQQSCSPDNRIFSLLKANKCILLLKKCYDDCENTKSKLAMFYPKLLNKKQKIIFDLIELFEAGKISNIAEFEATVKTLPATSLLALKSSPLKQVIDKLRNCLNLTDLIVSKPKASSLS